MKKIFWAFLTIVMFAFVFSSCTKHVSPTSTEDPVLYGSNFRIKTFDMSVSGVKQTAITYSYDNGGMTPTAASVITYDSAGAVSSTAEITFDAVGNTSNITLYNSAGLVVEYANPTVTSGLVTRQDYYDFDGNLYRYSTFEYDTAGRLTRQSEYDGAGNPTGYRTITYNADGNILVDETFLGTTSSSRTENTYDSSGNIIRSDMYMMSALYMYIITEYNASGKPVKATTYDGSDAVTGTGTITYNAAGNPIEEHISETQFGMTIAIDIYYTYNSVGIPMEINTSQSYMGMVMATTKNVFTYESF